MSFAEVDYRHGIDLVTISKGKKPEVEFLEYTPQHKLVILPENDEELTPKGLKKLIKEKLSDRDEEGQLNEDSVYLVLKIFQEKVSNDEIKELEALVATKNAVLCRIQKILPLSGISTLTGECRIKSVDDILERDPLDTLKETFLVKHSKEMTENQERMLKELLENIKEEI